MRKPRQNEDELLDRLTDVFRRFGYEGATLTLFSEATGLKRSSLYHRFPGGKPEMARRVLEHAGGIIAHEVLAPLRDSGDPAVRVRRMCDRLSEFYAHGEKSCLLDTLTLADQPEDEMRAEAANGYQAWHDALVTIAKEAGLPEQQADLRAEEALVLIEGGLVVARIQQNAAVFGRVLERLPSLLTQTQ